MPPLLFSPLPPMTEKNITRRTKQRETKRKQRLEQSQWQTLTVSSPSPKETLSTIQKAHGVFSPPALSNMKEASYGLNQDMQHTEPPLPMIISNTRHAPSIATNSSKQSSSPPTCKKSTKVTTSWPRTKAISPNSKTPPLPSNTTSKPIYLTTGISKEQSSSGKKLVTTSLKTHISPMDGIYQLSTPSTRTHASTPSPISLINKRTRKTPTSPFGKKDKSTQHKCTTHGNRCFYTSPHRITSPFQNASGIINSSISIKYTNPKPGKASSKEPTSDTL
mmetsp:Transcript_12475/g.17948  ORF Transcript_12475/g.17948 Transcript_12475/m.17948 type:complete len:277 (-) Transcript_12475:212-1042(-)